MTELASAYITLIPSLKGASSKIGEQLGGIDTTPAGRKIGEKLGNGAAEGAGKAKGKIGGVFKGIAGVATAAIGAISFGSVIAEAGRATDGMVKFKKTLDFAGLGTEQIDALAASTRKYADQTIYDLTDIQSITAQLASNGVANFDKLAEAGGNLNAIAGGTKESYRTVGLVLTQTAGAGKLTTENWNQLANAIPGASGKLQQAMLENGAYTGNFRDAMAKGEITAEEFNQAIMDLGFSDAAVEAAKATDTFEGSFGNLKASVVTGLTGLFATAQPMITGAMNALTTIVGPAFDGINQAFSFLVQGFQQAAPVFQTALMPMVTAFQNLLTTLAPIGTQITTMLLPALQNLGLAFAPVLAAVSGIVSVVISSVAPVLADIIPMVISLATTIADYLAPIVTDIGSLVDAVLPAIATQFKVSMGFIGGIIKAVWPTIQAIVTTVMDAIHNVISIVLAAINGDWTGVWNGIKAFFSGIWNGIKSIVSTAISGVANFISNGISLIRSWWSNGWNNVRSIVSNAWSAVKSVVSGGVSSVIGFVRSIPSRILSIFSNAGSLLKNSGRAIVQGLASGIRNATSIATGAVSRLLGKVRAFLPFSPAKVGPFSGHGWTLYSGRSIVEALAEGMVSRSGMLANATSGLMGMAHDTLSPAYSMPSTVSTSRPTSAAYEVRKLREELGGIIYNNTPVESDRSFARRVRAYA